MPVLEGIQLHQIYYVRLTGERVWIDSFVTADTWKCRRQVHTHDDGDIYIWEHFHTDELMSRQEHESELEVERQAMARLLKANGISVLTAESPLQELFNDREKN